MEIHHPNCHRRLRLGGICAFAAMLLLGVGCVEFDQTIVIDKSGSAVMTLSYSFDESLMPMLTSAQRVIEGWQKGQPLPEKAPLFWLTNEAAAKSWFSGDGIALKKYRNQVKDSRRLVHVTCAAKDFRQALATGKFGRFKLERDDAGNYLLASDWPEEASRPEATEDEMNRMRAYCHDMKLGLAIQTPTDILATSGETAKENVALWHFAVDRDDSFLRKRPVIRVVFRSTGLDWEPPKPPVVPPATVAPVSPTPATPATPVPAAPAAETPAQTP